MCLRPSSPPLPHSMRRVALSCWSPLTLDDRAQIMRGNSERVMNDIVLVIVIAEVNVKKEFIIKSARQNYLPVTSGRILDHKSAVKHKKGVMRQDHSLKK